jgi:rRNA biogenesis protein RRP5
VLAVDPTRKQVTLTLKKGLLGSKLFTLSDLRQAEPGMKLHGVVTGLAAFGVFVGFYGGVAGLMPTKELDLLPGQQAGDVYSVGQLVRVQVRPFFGVRQLGAHTKSHQASQFRGCRCWTK